MKNRSFFTGCLLLTLTVFFLLTGCPGDDGGSGDPNPSGTETKVAKKTVNGEAMTNIVYFEVNEGDPRAALGYVLNNADKTQYFDAVILFAANLRVRDCAAEQTAGGANHDCTKKGPHVHFNGNMSHILNNRAKYIKPLLDAGIKVLLGTLPDHDHFTYSSFFKWPFESVYPWDNDPNTDNVNSNPGYGFHSGKWYTGDADIYPFAALNAEGKSYSEVFIDDLVKVINDYGLDGFDIDDEYGSTQWSPDGLYQTQGATTNWGEYGIPVYNENAQPWVKQISQNMANFILMARNKLDASTAEGAPKKWITVFEYKLGDNFLRVPGVTMSNGEDVAENIRKYITWAYEGVYNSWVPDSTNRFPRDIYGPFSINIWRANPRADTDANLATIANRMDELVNALVPYNVMMYFAPTSLANLPNAEGYDNGRIGTVNGVKRTQAQYLSLFSKPIFGYDVIYQGLDYPQDWTRR